MKRIIPLTLALLLLAACGAPAAPPSATPAEQICEVDFVAGSEERAYTYTDEKLGLSLFIPDEFAPLVAISEGIDFWDEGGDSISLYYLPPQREYGCSLMKSIVRVPRREYFDPECFYNHYMASYGVVAASEDSLYVLVEPIGGVMIGHETLEAYTELCAKMESNFFKENMRVTAQDALPELTAESVLAAAEALSADGGATMTRAEAALWAAALLTAGNKDKDYELRYTDVEPGTDEALAIAYLDSYGMYYGHDEALFHPDDPLTRADFAELLQRMQLARFQLTQYPNWYGDPVEASDLDNAHWAYNAVNRAYQDGWLEMKDGKIRPDEPITCAEMATALTALHAELSAESQDSASTIDGLFSPYNETRMIEGLPEEVTLMPYGEVNEEASEYASYVLYLEDGYEVDVENHVLTARPANRTGIAAETHLEISQAPNMNADEAEQLVKSQCADANYTQQANQDADDGLHYTDNSGAAPALVDYYIIGSGKGGALIAEIRVPPEAAEGHGARLRQSLDTLEVFEP